MDIVPERLTLASALGADVAVNGADPHAAEQIRDACGDRPNIVIESGGTEPSTRLALASASWMGDVVLVTVPPEPMPLVPVLLREIRLSGARGGYGHYPESIELVRSGQIDVARLVTHHYPLDRLGQALEDVRARPGEIVRAAIIH
ncbi:MAG: zinc-binding dehydrogenase [Dehalococcoidia bacterium]